MREIKRVLGVFGAILFLASTHCSRNMEEPSAGSSAPPRTAAAAGASGVCGAGRLRTARTAALMSSPITATPR
jgi:hypothetical protein